MNTNIGELLHRRALLTGKRTAYVDSVTGQRMDFSTLNERCNQVANGLVTAGVKPGDRVALLMMNRAEFIESYFAIAKIGAVVVPLNWRLVADELEFILKDSGATTLIFSDNFIDLTTEIYSRGDATDLTRWYQVSATREGETHFCQDFKTFKASAAASEPNLQGGDDDMLYIMYTSGTTGLPKGVVHTHSTTFWALLTIGITCDTRDGDVYLAALPMLHVGALTPITLNIYRGASNIWAHRNLWSRLCHRCGECNLQTGFHRASIFSYGSSNS